MAHILYFFSFSTHLQTTKKNTFKITKKSQVVSYTSSDEHLVRERGKERERERDMQEEALPEERQKDA